MPEQAVQRKLAAILAADIAGYSRLVGLDEEGTLARLTLHRRGERLRRRELLALLGGAAIAPVAAAADRLSQQRLARAVC